MSKIYLLGDCWLDPKSKTNPVRKNTKYREGIVKSDGMELSRDAPCMDTHSRNFIICEDRPII